MATESLSRSNMGEWVDPRILEDLEKMRESEKVASRKLNDLEEELKEHEGQAVLMDREAVFTANYGRDGTHHFDKPGFAPPTYSFHMYTREVGVIVPPFVRRRHPGLKDALEIFSYVPSWEFTVRHKASLEISKNIDKAVAPSEGNIVISLADFSFDSYDAGRFLNHPRTVKVIKCDICIGNDKVKEAMTRIYAHGYSEAYSRMQKFLKLQ